MNAKFADSNVLLYVASGNSRNAKIAEQLLEGQPTISVQVLNEIANVFVTKWKRSWTDALEFLNMVSATSAIVPLDEATHELGLMVARRHKLHIYDSMIVASALLAGCDTLYSEDMHHGLVVEDRLRIVNPFRA
ncbi:MAG TPA: PIN domain-containing protein [Devosia sp.]|nr:PIN domain-containing protein [Devosia sp.]